MNLTRKVNYRVRLAAFTLIEVMLAIAIFALVMAAIYSSWSAILRGSRIGLAAAAEVQRTRIAIRSLEQSLGSAVLYSDNARYYSFFADTGGDYTYLSFVAQLPESFPGGGLYRDQPVRRVTFMVDGEGNLKLMQQPVLEACDMVEQPYTIDLAPHVSVFTMEFFDQRRNEWLPEWTLTNQLPRLVRVAMGFGDKNGRANAQSTTMRIIPLTSMAITRMGPGGLPQPNPAIPGSRFGNRFDDGQPSWSPCLPSNFGAKSGTVTRNSIFPP
jgi:type II secretion system protein J